MRKVIRFYCPECENSTDFLLKNNDVCFETSDTSIEICTMRGNDLLTYTYDEEGKRIEEEDWKPLDKETEYYLLVEFKWLNMAGVPYGNLKHSSNPKFSRIPEEIVKLFDKKNVVSVGIWQQRDDAVSLCNTFEKIKSPKFHNCGGYYAKDPVRWYNINKIEPRIWFREKPDNVERKPQGEQLELESESKDKIISGLKVVGDINLLDTEIVSLIGRKYEGCALVIRKKREGISVLIRKPKQPSN